jgi:hypothetical protein
MGSARVLGHRGVFVCRPYLFFFGRRCFLLPLLPDYFCMVGAVVCIHSLVCTCVPQPFVPIGEAATLKDGALLANNGVMYLCSVCPGKKLWLKKHVEDHVVSKVV